MKNNNVVYVIAIVCAFLLSAILLSEYMSFVRKVNEDFYNKNISKSCKNLINVAYKRHISEKNDKRNALLESLKGSPLTEEEKYKQFQYGVSDMMEAINNNPSGESSGKGMDLSSVFKCYDSDMNSIMQENTLLLVKKAKVKNAVTILYYDYQDDTLAEEMNAIIEKYGEDIKNVEFHIEDVYIKDLSFVPMRIYYVVKDENGNESKETELISNIDKLDELKKDGYELFEINNTFDLDTSYFDHEEECYISYISKLSDEEQKRVDELFAEGMRVKANDETYVFFSKRPNLYTNENVSIEYCNFEESEYSFYVMTYEKRGIVFELINYLVVQKGGLLYTIIQFPAIAVIFLVSLIVARKYIIRKSNIE